jgi:hypothetical protein
VRAPVSMLDHPGPLMVRTFVRARSLKKPSAMSLSMLGVSADVPPDVVPLPMLGFEAPAVQEVGAF